MTRAVLLAGVAWLAAGPAWASQSQPPSAEHFAFATLDNGASLGFALLRTGGGAEAGRDISEEAFARSNTVSRVLLDTQSGSYFGYRLEVSPEKNDQFKVKVQGLPSGIDREIRTRGGCSACATPQFLGLSGNFPPPRIVADGGVFTLDLLVNRTTGEKILDLVTVSRGPLNKQAMREAVQRFVTFLDAVKKADYNAARSAFPAAILQYQRALEIHPGDAMVRNRLAMCLQRSNRLAEADREYERALEINPSYAEAWNNRGTVAQARGDYENAARLYKKAVSIKPDFPQAYRNLGTAYFAMKRFEDGFEAYQAAYRLDPAILETPTSFSVEASGADAALQSFYFAKISAASGQIDTAFKFLRRAFEKGFRDFDRVDNDRDLKPVVADPRYEPLRGEFSRRMLGATR